MPRPYIASFALGLMLATVAVASAADWPQWRGPDRTGISTEAGWRTDWTANAPKVLWKKNVGQGYSSFSVVSGKVFTMGNADGKLLCMSSKGELIAAAASPDGFKELGRTKVLGDTCWTTPILSGGRIYCRNHDGDVVCLDVQGK